jgi:integrase
VEDFAGDGALEASHDLVFGFAFGEAPSDVAAGGKGSRLGLENWKRAVGWRIRIAELGRPTMRVHDLPHTDASLARSAGADMKLLQVTMGHASIMVTAHTYADLYDSDLDRVADALDGLGG